MFLDKIHSFQTGVSLEISTAALRALVADAMAGQRVCELEQIRCPGDLYAYLSIIVHSGAEGLIKRRHPWANEIKAGLLARKAVAYGRFGNLFWRNLDEEDPDGDAWYRLIADERFHSQLVGLLDMIRSAQRTLHQRVATASDLDWGGLGMGAVAAF